MVQGCLQCHHLNQQPNMKRLGKAWFPFAFITLVNYCVAQSTWFGTLAIGLHRTKFNNAFNNILQRHVFKFWERAEESRTDLNHHSLCCKNYSVQNNFRVKLKKSKYLYWRRTADYIPNLFPIYCNGKKLSSGNPLAKFNTS